MKRQCLVGCLILVLVPALAGAQSKPERFIGDDGVQTQAESRSRLGEAGRSTASTGDAKNLIYRLDVRTPLSDLDRTRDIVYDRWRRDGQGNLIQPLQKDPTPGRIRVNPETGTVLPTAGEWLAFLRDALPRNDDVDFDGQADPAGTKPLTKVPPRNKVLVVDQGERKRRMDAGLPPEVFENRLVTIVERWVEAVPVYENRTVVAYPCCCNRTVSVLVRYDYVPRVKIRTEMRPVADYPMAEVVVDRGIVVLAGSPQFSTVIPRLCEFHYGPGAKFEAPTVPLVSNIKDLPTFEDRTTTSESGGVTTEITEPYAVPYVRGSGPRGRESGGIPLRSGSKVAPLDAYGGDRGVQTHAGDRAEVHDLTLSIKDVKQNPAVQTPIEQPRTDGGGGRDSGSSSGENGTEWRAGKDGIEYKAGDYGYRSWEDYDRATGGRGEFPPR